MTFDDVLEQVIALLKRQGRVSYGAIKRRFELTDDYLDDIKIELVEAQRLAADENGRILVWIGEVETTPAEPHTPEAERRQLTVMFCDLVGSTLLSGQLDPEALRDVVRAYQASCNEVIQRFEGHVAQHLGDGLLVYFGYPAAHEDNVQRAIRSGLGIIDVMQALNQRLENLHGVQLAVRLGIHTGPVVIGDIGAGPRQEQLALGETPNIAARIQALAEPDTLVISDATYRLVEGFFDAEPLGAQDLKGVAYPLAVYRVLGDRGLQSRLDVTSRHGLTPLVGRHSERQLLIDRWRQAKSGEGQVVLLNAAPGLGKSRMLQALKEHLIKKAYTRLECRSSPYYQNTAFYPVADLIQRTLAWEQNDSSDERLLRLEQALAQYQLPVEEAVPLMAGLLSFPLPADKYPPLNLTPQRQRQQTLETIAAIILELAQREPVLFIVEDLHWTDPSTLEVLDLLINQTPTASLYTLLTCRPEFQNPWANQSYVTHITLNRLSRDEIEQLIARVAGAKPLPAAVVEQLVDKTDGVPLYVEEMTKAVLESGRLKTVDGQYELTGPTSTLAIPATLQDSLMSRLDRLVTAKSVAQYASVIGRQFSYDLLQAVSELDEATLQRELRRLVDAELVYQRGVAPHATYFFKHALIQDTAYESLLRSTRQGYHRRIAEVLEAQFPEVVETQPELLAHHCAAANLDEQAVDYWRQAGEKAVQRSANMEAIAHLNRGLERLAARPHVPEQRHQELDLLIILGPALIATKGYVAPEVKDTYNRAYELCRDVGEETQRFAVLSGLRRFYLVRGEFNTTRDIGNELLTLAQRQQDSTFLLEAYWALAGVLFLLGEFVLVQRYLKQAVAIFASRRENSQTIRHGTVPGIHCLGWLSLTSWMLGFSEQALQQSQQTLELAQQQTSRFAQRFCFSHARMLHHYRREATSILEKRQSEKILQSGYPITDQRESSINIADNWALFIEGKRENIVSSMRDSLDISDNVNFRPYLLSFLVEIYGKTNQIQDGLETIEEGFTLIQQMGAYFYEAELHRLKGQLLLQQSPDNQTKAEACFQHAISIAQRQSAKSWELHAAASLAKLWQQQGKRQEAYDLLAPAYGWFTEGFDTADLIEAKALLDRLV